MIRSTTFSKVRRLDKYLRELVIQAQLGILTEIEVAEKLLHFLKLINLKLKDLDFGFSDIEDPASESD